MNPTIDTNLKPCWLLARAIFDAFGGNWVRADHWDRILQAKMAARGYA